MSSMRSASSITRMRVSVSRIAAALEHVDQPAGRGDQHIDAAHQHVLLVGHALAADDQRVGELQVFAVLDEIFGDLQREFARRLQDQAARHAGAGARAGQDVQHRQGEAGGLAGAGLRHAQHVAAHQHERDRLLLDRGGMAIAHVVDGAQHGPTGRDRQRSARSLNKAGRGAGTRPAGARPSEATPTGATIVDAASVGASSGGSAGAVVVSVKPGPVDGRLRPVPQQSRLRRLAPKAGAARGYQEGARESQPLPPRMQQVYAAPHAP